MNLATDQHHGDQETQLGCGPTLVQCLHLLVSCESAVPRTKLVHSSYLLFFSRERNLEIEFLHIILRSITELLFRWQAFNFR